MNEPCKFNISNGSLGTESPQSVGALSDREIWVKQQSVTPMHYKGDKPVWYDRLSRFLPKSPETKFLEVGVVPGRIMLFFAQTMHYRCTGVDFLPKISEVKLQYEKLGVEAKLVEADFFNWQNDELFDIVYSKGFIEHFTDYESVIRKHWEKVAPGGLMILEVPTFITPVQWWIREVFYEPWFFKDVLSFHNLDIMSLDALKTSVMKVCPGEKILVATRDPGIKVPFRCSLKGIRKGFGRKMLWLLIKISDKILRLFGISSRWFSGGAVVMIRKMEPSSLNNGTVR